MPRKLDIGKVLGRVFGNIDVEAVIANLAPALLPGLVSQFPALQQMGIQPEMIRAALAAPQKQPGEAPEEDRIEVPSGGAFRFVRAFPKMSGEQLRAIVDKIMESNLFLDEAEHVLDCLYAAHALIESEKIIDQPQNGNNGVLPS